MLVSVIAQIVETLIIIYQAIYFDSSEFIEWETNYIKDSNILYTINKT